MDAGSPETLPHAVVTDLGLRMGQDGDARLALAFLAIVARVHDLVADLRPSNQDLRAVVDFLTEVGHTADERRQEWVLLADVIGVSTRVEDLNCPRPAGATPNTLPGPFYRPDVPDLAQGTNLSRDGVGEAMQVVVHVVDLGGAAIAEAQVEVWHANALGRYENQDPDLQPEFNLRGRLRSDAHGQVQFVTVKPRGYALPEDGPVGRLLSAIGLRLERPAHLHFRVVAPGFQTLTTQIFDRQDPAINRDALFGVRPELCADFRDVTADFGDMKHALDLRLVLVATGENSGDLPAPNRFQKEN